MYPTGITARTLITNCSKLSSEAALLLYATPHEITRLIFACSVDLLIVSNSRYGESGTFTQNGTLGVSGTNAYTLAATVLNALDSGVRTELRIVDAGTIERYFPRRYKIRVNQTLY